MIREYKGPVMSPNYVTNILSANVVTATARAVMGEKGYLKSREKRSLVTCTAIQDVGRYRC